MNDEDDRTTAFGLFNLAHSYWRSAVALQKVKVKATHPDNPIWFLYIHAVELYLKSFLRAQDVTVADLRKQYSHRVGDLAGAAQEKGLQFDDEDEIVLKLITELDLTTLRYLKTGSFTRPTHEALDRTCNSIHESVAEVLKAQGNSVRQFPKA